MAKTPASATDDEAPGDAEQRAKDQYLALVGDLGVMIHHLPADCRDTVAQDVLADYATDAILWSGCGPYVCDPKTLQATRQEHLLNAHRVLFPSPAPSTSG